MTKELTKQEHRQREANKRWAKQNPERIKEIRRRHRERHQKQIAEYARAYKKRKPVFVKELKRKWERDNPIAKGLMSVRKRLKTEGLSEDYKHATTSEYKAVLEAQGGGCAICGATVANKSGHLLYVDHDHATGRLRGLLCNGCNSTPGQFDDDSSKMARAILYLRLHAEHRDTPWEERVQKVLDELSGGTMPRTR